MRKKNVITVAVGQFNIRLFDRSYNLNKMSEQLFHACSLCNPDVMLFPEGATSGYNFSDEGELMQVAEPDDGPTVTYMKELAEATGTTLIFGFFEKADGLFYNTAVIIEPGQEIKKYHKVHLPYLGGDRFSTCGDRIGLFDTSFGKIGLMICYDLRFPELARELALQGARIIFLPTELPKGGEAHPDYLSKARSCENRVYIVTANRIGRERGFKYIGRSQIISYTGEVLVEAGENEVVLFETLDLALAENKDIVVIPGEYETHLFKDRHPELYCRIANPPGCAGSSHLK